MSYFRTILNALGIGSSPPVSNTGNPNTQNTEEIERKFLVKSKPTIPPDAEIQQITQAYLFVSDEREERIRRTESNGRVEYTKTVKTTKDESGLQRGEDESPITEGEYKSLLLSAKGKIIDKTRYVIPHDNGLKLEYDIYEGSLKGLEVVEVEFPNVEASNQFTPPAWFGADVTSHKGLKNKNLAMKGIPEDLLAEVNARRLASQGVFAAWTSL